MAKFKTSITACGMLILLVLAGCATTEGKSSRLPNPAGSATGEKGIIFLAVTGENIPALESGTGRKMRLTALGAKPKVRYKGGRPEIRKKQTGRWVTMTEINDNGDKLGTVISPYDSDDLLREAFSRKLKAAGYKVRLVKTLPTNVAKGMNLSRISFDADRTTGLLETDGSCNVTISLDLWRNGLRKKQLEYEAFYSDSAIYDRDELLETLIQGSLNNLMKQAVPDIIKELDSQS